MLFGRPRKLTPHQAREAPKRVDAGEPLREIALSFNVDHSTPAQGAAGGRGLIDTSGLVGREEFGEAGRACIRVWMTARGKMFAKALRVPRRASSAVASNGVDCHE